MRVDEGVKWAVVMAIGSALIAAVIGIVVVDYVFRNPAGSFDVLVVPPAVAAAALLGGTLWWRLVEQPHTLTDGRAMMVGFLVGLLAHPLTWAIYMLGGPLFLPAGWSEPWNIVRSILAFSAFSVLFSGALTIIGGVLYGLTVMRCRRYLDTQS
jgi:hypothetical protein